jgi:hypothetical protein
MEGKNDKIGNIFVSMSILHLYHFLNCPFSTVSTLALGPLSLLSNQYWGSFPGGERARSVKLTTHASPVPSLKMRGVILPFINIHP